MNECIHTAKHTDTHVCMYVRRVNSPCTQLTEYTPAKCKLPKNHMNKMHLLVSANVNGVEFLSYLKTLF